MLDSGCAAIEIREHAYLEAGGGRWKCERGYARSAERCMLIEVPANAYLDLSGDQWSCSRGYRKLELGATPLAQSGVKVRGCLTTSCLASSAGLGNH